MFSRRLSLPLPANWCSSSKDTSKWSSMASLPRPVTKMASEMPEAATSSTAYCTKGLSTMGSISLGCALVAGKKRVPKPATGRTALRIVMSLFHLEKQHRHRGSDYADLTDSRRSSPAVSYRNGHASFPFSDVTKSSTFTQRGPNLVCGIGVRTESLDFQAIA